MSEVVSQRLVDERDRHAALADRGRDALDRSVADVTAGEDARHARLEQIGITLELPGAAGRHVRAGQHEAARIESDLGRKPRRLGVRADEDEDAARLEPRRLAGDTIPDVDRLQGELPVRGDDLRLADVRARHELVDQVARHALLEAATAAKYRDAARMVCEEERR